MIKSYIKDGKKVYEVYVAARDINKQLIARRKRNIASERQAKEIEFEFKVELSHLSKTGPVWTWSKWTAELYRQMALTLKAGTIINYKTRLAKWIPPEWENKEMRSFTKSDVLNLLERVQNSPEPVSQKILLSMIKRVFQAAVEDRVLDINPASALKVRHEKKIPLVLNSKEAEILLSQAKLVGHRFYPIWVFALQTGMRSGEMYALLWSDVDFETGLIKVTKQWTNKDGVTSTKTGESRVVPMSDELVVFLKELKLQGPAESDHVLPRLREWTNGMQADVLKEFCVGLGITPVKFHDLRATFITNLLAQGVPLVKVMAIVGHRKMATTDGYLRLAGVDIKGATNALGFSIPQNEEGKVLQLLKK